MPRIAPGGLREIGLVNFVITRVLGVATGTRAPNVFTTLARRRGMFRAWLRFAGTLMPGGRLPRTDTELVILRVAHNCGCDYEWRHHERLGRAAGLSTQQIDDVRRGPDAPGWSERQRVLLSAVDELHADRRISDHVWERLKAELSDGDLIELCMLAGHYEMLAMTLNSIQIQPDEPAGRAGRALGAILAPIIPTQDRRSHR
jgi:AhpD family alkylhydroperoxidase